MVAPGALEKLLYLYVARTGTTIEIPTYLRRYNAIYMTRAEEDVYLTSSDRVGRRAERHSMVRMQ